MLVDPCTHFIRFHSFSSLGIECDAVQFSLFGIGSIACICVCASSICWCVSQRFYYVQMLRICSCIARSLSKTILLTVALLFHAGNPPKRQAILRHYQVLC